MKHVRNYQEYLQLGSAYDRLLGNQKWKISAETDLYDWQRL